LSRKSHLSHVSIYVAVLKIYIRGNQKGERERRREE